MCNTTKHSNTCKMGFGKKDASCPRCQELLSGSAPRAGWQRQYYSQKKSIEAQRSQDIKTHDCKKSGCGIICTAGGEPPSISPKMRRAIMDEWNRIYGEK